MTKKQEAAIDKLVASYNQPDGPATAMPPGVSMESIWPVIRPLIVLARATFKIFKKAWGQALDILIVTMDLKYGNNG